MAPLTVQDLLSRNASTISTYVPLPFFSEMPALGISRLTTIIITCADPRVCPELFFGLKPTDAIIFRTAGGRVKPVLQDIAVLDEYFGHDSLKQLLIVHHTDCGASHIVDSTVKEGLISRHPESKAEIQAWDTGAFGDRSIPQSVHDDIAIAKADPYMPEGLKQGIRGFVFDVKSGRVQEL